MRWWTLSLLLCTFGFSREFRPSEPFVIKFLSGEWRNITEEQLNRELYPVGTYSYLAQLVVIFLVTDICRYKAVIVASACVGIAMNAMLLWTVSLNALQVVYGLYGTFAASEVAYYTYMYAKVDRSKYQRVTAHTRSAILGGRFISAVVAQILVTTELMNVRELCYISFAVQCLSLVPALALPSVSTSIYFYSSPTTQSSISEPHKSSSLSFVKQVQDTDSANTIEPKCGVEKADLSLNVEFSYQKAFALLWIHFKKSYSKTTLVMWSVWWALGTCTMGQVESYAQFLWQHLSPEEHELYNGITFAAVTLLGALSAYCVGIVSNDVFDRFGIWLIVVCSALQGCLVVAMAMSDNVIIAYLTYVLCGTIYFFLITVASSAAAQIISNDCFALVFGFNTFAALALQSIVTALFVSGNVFLLGIQAQFLVYAVMFLWMSVAFCIFAAVRGCVRKIRKDPMLQSCDSIEIDEK